MSFPQTLSPGMAPSPKKLARASGGEQDGDSRGAEAVKKENSTIGSLAGEFSGLSIDDNTIDDTLPPPSQEQVVKELDELYDQQAAAKLVGVPALNMPTQLKTQLLPHQQDGVRYFVHQERTGGVDPPYYKKKQKANGTTAWVCSLTRRHRTDEPPKIRGGILGDDMGLGKTLQTIAACLANPPDGVLYPCSSTGTRRHPVPTSGGPSCTLVVCPVSVIANWLQQINIHVEPGTLRTAIYTGPKRHKLISKIKNHEVDMLFTSYQTLSADFTVHSKNLAQAKNKAKMETIFDTAVWRIVLDEAHVIRNPSTANFKAVSAMDTVNKHCLTGTPFINKPNDLQSLFEFLGLEPLNDKHVFDACITKSIAEGRKVGLARLRNATLYAMLRRTKRKTHLKLVRKTHTLVKVEMPAENPHTEIHKALFMTAQAAFDAAMGLRAAGEKVGFAMMFEMVLRVRQACCHGELLSTKRVATAIKDARDLEGHNSLSVEESKLLLEKLVGASDEEEGEEARKPLGDSPKIIKLLEIINKEMSPDEKGVIFCSFTKHLDLVENALVKRGHKCTRIVGSMNPKQRVDAMSAFNREDAKTSPRFILCSLMAAGVGINLLRGNVAFMLSPWWNEAAQTQAMDRIHRLGQTRPVRVYSLVIADSIEERLLKIQMHKTVTGKGSMQKLTKKEEKRVKLATMRDLFQIGEKDKEDIADFIADSDDSDEEFML